MAAINGTCVPALGGVILSNLAGNLASKSHKTLLYYTKLSGVT